MSIRVAILGSKPERSATYAKRLAAVDGIKVVATISSYAAMTEALSNLSVDVLVADAVIARSASDPAPCYLIPNLPDIRARRPDIQVFIITTDEIDRVRRYVPGASNLRLLNKLDPRMPDTLAAQVSEIAGRDPDIPEG